jgi:hypothetical protein
MTLATRSFELHGAVVGLATKDVRDALVDVKFKTLRHVQEGSVDQVLLVRVEMINAMIMCILGLIPTVGCLFLTDRP